MTYWKILTRQLPLLDRAEQEKFRNAKITVIGCGGIGGEAIEMLARMGVGKLVLVDEDEFDITNLNRQTLATFDDIGHDKSSTAESKVKAINPNVKTVSFSGHVNQENIGEILKGSSLVIDALDNVLTRVIVSRKARELRIPFVHGAIHGSLGQVTVFLPNTKSYEEMFNLPSLNEELNDETIAKLENVAAGTPPAFGPTPNLVGCLEAMEAFKIITGIGRVTVSPKILTFDLLDFSSFSIDEI
ncbi:HesA/MoeB/ThiF family protein [Methanobrevibacter sp.]